jgi:hypothetical protein
VKNCPDSLKQNTAVPTVRGRGGHYAMCHSRRPCPKAPRPSPLSKSSIHYSSNSFPPSTSALRTLPRGQDAFLGLLLFQGTASGAFYKSIGGSYPKLTSAYCDSVRDQCSATTRYLRFSRLSLLSLVSSVPGETRPTIPKCLLSAWPFLRVEFKARAEYEGI